MECDIGLDRRDNQHSDCVAAADTWVAGMVADLMVISYYR